MAKRLTMAEALVLATAPTPLTDCTLMQFDISNPRLRQPGPFRRPYDGEYRWVHTSRVAGMRDEGWDIVHLKEEA